MHGRERRGLRRQLADQGIIIIIYLFSTVVSYLNSFDHQ